MFQSTPSGGKATRARVSQHRIEIKVSIHAFRGEGDATAPPTGVRPQRFNPRLPGGRRRAAPPRRGRRTRFNPRLPGGRRPNQHSPIPSPPGFNPRLPGGRRPVSSTARTGRRMVSIHAFRGEGDGLVRNLETIWRGFNPRLPGGRRRRTVRTARRTLLFQSTPSGGKATQRSARRSFDRMFQSTPSGGKATSCATRMRGAASVSIHAFRGEGDAGVGRVASEVRSFNPRLPGGRRRWTGRWATSPGVFQSTPSGGKATSSSTASVARTRFQSTPSGGKATGLW